MSVDWKQIAVRQIQLTHAQKLVEESLATNRITLFSGGNRAGKTMLAVRTAVLAILGYYDWCPTPARVCISTLAKHQAASALQEYLEQFILSLPEGVVKRHTTREELTSPIKFYDGGVLHVKSAAGGWKHYQGAGYDLVILDESHPEKVFKELTVRLRGRKSKAEKARHMKVLLSMTPTEGITWEKPKLVDAMLAGTRTDVGFVQSAIFENGFDVCETCETPRAQWDRTLEAQGLERTSKFHYQLKSLCGRCHTFGVEPRFEQQELQGFEDEFQGSELAMRLYGDFLPLGGNLVFEPAEQVALRTLIEDPIRTEGGARIFREPNQHRHVMGVDCAEGRDGDEAVMQIVDAEDGDQTVCWADNAVEPEIYVHDVQELAEDYQIPNDCLVIESEKSGGFVIQSLKSDPVFKRRLYRHRSLNKVKRGKRDGQIGWYPSAKGRYTILRNMIAGIRRCLQPNPDGSVVIRRQYPDGRAIPHPLLPHDRETIEQLCKLHHNEDKGRIDVTDGHDDRVLALALAHEARMDRIYGKLDTQGATKRTAWQQYWIDRDREFQPRRHIRS